MKFLRDVSIKKKLEAIILVTAAAVLLLSLVLFMAVKISSARSDATNHLRALATLLGANSDAAVVFGDKRAASEVLSTLSSQGDVILAQILLPDGTVFARYHSRIYPEGDEQDVRGSNQGFHLTQIAVEETIVVDGEVVALIRILGDMSQVHSILLQQAILVLGVFVLSMLLAMLLSSRLHRVVSEPVNHLRETMGVVAEKRDFSQRAERLSNDELGDLVDGFNMMLDQLQQYDRELRDYRQDLERQVVSRTQELEWAKGRAEDASRAKSDFLATMSHEIRTPMSGVLGFTSLLEKTDLDRQQKEYVEIVTSSARSLLAIIDDILDFSKMEAGKTRLEPTDFELAPLVESIRMLFTAKAAEKGIKLAVDMAPDIPPLLQGDPVRLRQVLVNLVDNAIKFTQRGQVSLRIILASMDSTGVDLCIEVSDSGIGMSPQQQEILFQPFQQSDSSITRRYGGTGLGLVITQRLVKLMGGEITLVSMPGKGSTFTALVHLGLPRASVAPESGDPGSASRSESFDLDGVAVLVVDDHPVNLMLATALLNDEGATAIGVKSAREALAEIRDQHFDLVLMDLEMPEMSGIEAARTLRQSAGANRNIPIIAVTAHAFPEKREEAIAAGMNDLLAKPYVPEQLFAMVQQWCRHPGVSL